MRALLLGVLLLASCASALAQNRSPEADRAAVTALEQRWLEHLTDPEALNEILADDFQHPVGSGDVLSKSQHIGWAAAHPAPSGTTLRFESLNVRSYGDTAIATGIVERRDSGETQRTIFTDVFVFRHGRWQAVSAQETPIAP